MERAFVEETSRKSTSPASDPLDMLRWLTTCRRFDTLAITQDTSGRNPTPLPVSAPRWCPGWTTSKDIWSDSIEVEVGALSTAQVARVAQLTQKTNQFNLTTRRYTETEVQDLTGAQAGGSSLAAATTAR